MTGPGPLSSKEIDRLVEAAAKAVNYEEGFGVAGCDLNASGWWAAYARQSLVEQSQNNRLADYFRTCAQEAKGLGVTVPREYILYDAVTGEHLERPAMIRLRELKKSRRIGGVIFPAMDRLSREPLHQQVFELEANYYGVEIHYADAPNGNDPMSQMTRNILAHASKVTKLSNHKNARGGNIGRVLKGMVPAHKAPYGYCYRRDADIAPDGRLHVKLAWWEIDSLGPDSLPLPESPAWVVTQIFFWVGEEQRTLHWVVRKLNEELNITTAYGRKWTPGGVSKIVYNSCYTGECAYNVHSRVANPNTPMGDITAEIKRTIREAKPESEWVRYQVPPLVSLELWEKARKVVAERGRGRGKQGKIILALLRNRIICPRCGSPMVVRRGGRKGSVYYHCSRYFKHWIAEPCSYKRFIPSSWDEFIWEDICSIMRDDAWVAEQIVSEENQGDNFKKLIRFHRFKVSLARSRVAKVQEGFEAGIYELQQAKEKISQYQITIAKEEKSLEQLLATAREPQRIDLAVLTEELKVLRDRNLDEATFEEKEELLSRLGVMVYPSEDLKSMKVTCHLGLLVKTPNNAPESGESLMTIQEEREHSEGCGKVSSGPPLWTISRTPGPFSEIATGGNGKE